MFHLLYHTFQLLRLPAKLEKDDKKENELNNAFGLLDEIDFFFPPPKICCVNI